MRNIPFGHVARPLRPHATSFWLHISTPSQNNLQQACHLLQVPVLKLLRPPSNSCRKPLIILVGEPLLVLIIAPSFEHDNPSCASLTMLTSWIVVLLLLHDALRSGLELHPILAHRLLLPGLALPRHQSAQESVLSRSRLSLTPSVDPSAPLLHFSLDLRQPSQRHRHNPSC